MSKIAAHFKQRSSGVKIHQYTLLFVLIGIFLLFSVITDSKITTPMNLNNIIMQNSYIVVLAIGMLLCILTGGINLSVGSVVAFVGGMGAILVVHHNLPVPLVFVIMLAVGTLIGMIEGFFIAFMRIPAFIVTLATMLMFRGLSLVMLNSQTIGPLPSGYTAVGAGYLPKLSIDFGFGGLDLVSLLTGLVVSVVLIANEIRLRRNKSKHGLPNNSIWFMSLKLAVTILILNFITIKLAAYNGLPIVLVIIIAIIVIYSFVTQNTIAGRHIYAVGGNANAARLSGIKTEKVLFGVYINNGLLCAIAAIILTARNGSATPKAGEGFELDAIASVFIGGASTMGGIGTVAGSIIGAFIMGILNNGMSLAGLSIEWQRVVKGFVLLCAVTLDIINKRKR